MTGLVAYGGLAGQVLTKLTDQHAGQPVEDYAWRDPPVVQHDASLAGDGTAALPLAVEIVDGGSF